MKRRNLTTCKSCSCEASGMKIQYQCDCKDKDCTCDSVIEFEKKPKAEPHCYDTPMKRIR